MDSAQIGGTATPLAVPGSPILPLASSREISRGLSKSPRSPRSPRAPRSPRTFTCTYCNKVYNKASKLTQHIRKHTGERPYACEYDGCAMTFTRPAHLRRHVSTIHEHEKSFACPKCDKKFGDKTHLKRHEIQHEKPKPFLCSVEGCDASFAKHNQLKRHLCVHTGELPYACPHNDCGKRFAFPGQLKVHVNRIHSQLKRFLCSICSEAFVKYSELVVHQREENHLPKIIFQCAHCGLEVKSKKNLKAHELTHDLDRDLFRCKLCSKEFSTPSNLKAHIRSAHDEIKHECPFCHAEFAHKHTLARHKRTHEALTPTDNTTPLAHTPDEKEADDLHLDLDLDLDLGDLEDEKDEQDGGEEVPDKFWIDAFGSEPGSDSNDLSSYSDSEDGLPHKTRAPVPTSAPPSNIAPPSLALFGSNPSTSEPKSPGPTKSKLSRSQSILDKFLGGVPPRISIEKPDESE